MKNQHRSGVSSRRDFVKCVGTAACLASFGTVATDRLVGEEPTTPLTFSSATRLAKLIAERQVTAVEVAEAHLNRIDEVNPKLNAIFQVDANRVRAEAQQADTDLSRGV